MKVYEFLKETILNLTDVEEASLSPSMTLEDIQLDSLDYVEIQVSLKKEFGVVLDAELLASGSIKTLGDLCEHIETLQSSCSQAVAA